MITVAFTLLFVTNLAWIFSYRDLQKENDYLKNDCFDSFYRGVATEREVVKNNFIKAKTPEEFCEWVDDMIKQKKD